MRSVIDFQRTKSGRHGLGGADDEGADDEGDEGDVERVTGIELVSNEM